MNTSFERKAMKEEWLTPRYIIEALGPFDLDPCAPIVRPWPTAREHYTIEHNGLLQPWKGFVWCNPPYGRQTAKWLARLAEHPEGGLALTFARTETEMFRDRVWRARSAVSLFFFYGRLVFVDVEGNPKLDKHGRPQSAGAPSVLIAYGKAAAKRIRQARIAGKIDGRHLYL